MTSCLDNILLRIGQFLYAAVGLANWTHVTFFLDNYDTLRVGVHIYYLATK